LLETSDFSFKFNSDNHNTHHKTIKLPYWKGEMIRHFLPIVDDQETPSQAPILKYGDFLPWAVQKNGWTDQFAVWVVGSIRPKDAQVQSYSAGDTNVPSWEDTLPPTGEYYWTIRVRRRCALREITFTTCNLWPRPLRWAVAQIAERFEPNTVLWAFDTIESSSFMIWSPSFIGC